MQVSVIKDPFLYLDHLCVREPCPPDPTEGPLLFILRVPPGAHRATRCTGTCSHPSVAPFLHIPCWWGRGREEPTHTWGREAEPASASSRATRLVARRSLRGPERRVRGRPGCSCPSASRQDSCPGSPGWLAAWVLARDVLLSLHLTDQGHTGTERWDCHRPTLAPRDHCPAAPDILDRPYAARTGHQVARMVHAFPPALGICAGSCKRTHAPLGTER